jgi:multidrug efflux system membrane fusion protein
MPPNLIFRRGGDGSLVVLPLPARAGARSQPAVWVVDPATSQVRLKPVTVGQYREDGVSITGGLAEGDLVVTAGVHKLRPGQAVKAKG